LTDHVVIYKGQRALRAFCSVVIWGISKHYVTIYRVYIIHQSKLVWSRHICMVTT